MGPLSSDSGPVGAMVDNTQGRFESSRALRMFPTFVWKADLKGEIHQDLNRTILAALDDLRRCHREPAPGRGWQSQQDLHQLAAFRELVACVNEAAATTLEHLKIGHQGFEITACWANVNGPGVEHRRHSHPNNFLSGVYYVKTRPGADTINFHDPRPQSGIIRPPVKELTAETTDQVVVTVSDGSLLLFPSWLRHSVDANRSDQERVSVSFNIMFTSFTKSMSQPLWDGGSSGA